MSLDRGVVSLRYDPVLDLLEYGSIFENSADTFT